VDPSPEAIPPPNDVHGGPASGPFTMRIPRTKLLRTLATIIVIILVAHLSVHIYHYTVHPVPELLFNAVDVDVEDNFSTWYQASTLLIAGLLALFIAAKRRAMGDPLAIYWRVLGIVFAFGLSADEIAGFHETLNTVMTTSWTVPALIATGIFGLAFIPFLLRIPRDTARRLVVAGAVYVGGAAGMERFSEWFIKVSSVTFHLMGHDLVIRHTAATMAKTLDYSLSTAVEEGLEMLGVWLFIRALLLFMSAQDHVVIAIAPGSPADPGVARGASPPTP
jgi:hypothetical protein